MPPASKPLGRWWWRPPNNRAAAIFDDAVRPTRRWENATIRQAGATNYRAERDTVRLGRLLWIGILNSSRGVFVFGKSVTHDDSRGMWRLPLALAVTIACTLCTASTVAQESTEESMAAYADAANFQTNGALPLAIDGWHEFLKKYPDDPMASKAAHYLGVCLMQQEQPDYVAAAQAFGKALQDTEYELREESLVNRGWCLYASAGEGQQRDAKPLQASLDTFAQLRKEFPESRYLDRALFYGGEAAYGLAKPQQAVDFYDQLLNLASAKDSPLRCDAFYARGVAYEDLKEYDKAIASYRQLLDQCATGTLVTDVHLRMGDLLVLRKQFADAVKSFAAAIESSEVADDTAYALFRQGFALVQADQPADAATAYDRLAKEYPNSKYAASATLAAAQSAYRGGKLDMAEKRFLEVLSQNNPAAATESAHWLARIALSRGEIDNAIQLAKKQLDAGADGEFVISLQLDHAEALSLKPESLAESMVVYEKAYRDHPQNALAPRALYNAAYSAMQSGKYDKAIAFAKEFNEKFAGNVLAPDVQFVNAESLLLSGKGAEAAELYQSLIATGAKDNIQRPLWVLRGAASLIANQKFDDATKLISTETASWNDKRNLAEAKFLLGQANMMSNKPADASKEFDAAFDLDPSWPRADEARLLAAQSKNASGDRDGAVIQWKKIITDNPASRMAAQARYKLAQLASSEGSFQRSIELYDEVLGSTVDPGLYPYSQYGKAWSLMQLVNHADAVKILDELIEDFASHPVVGESRLARGVSLRHLDKNDRAKGDLELFLQTSPTGLNLGHALYELALIEQKNQQPGKAAKYLERLATEVPNYPSMAKVLYEWGWLLNETGDAEAAAGKFKSLVDKYPDDELTGEAAFFVGQHDYSQNRWADASKQFVIAAEKASEPALSEKAYYRLGWSHFKSNDFEQAAEAFKTQAERHPQGNLLVDALMMIGEADFKAEDFEGALESYTNARKRVRDADDSAKTLRDPAERQVRELVLLHGGQSAAQLKQWKDALQWYDELRERFPSTSYLPQVFYETGFTYQQLGDNEKAMKFYGQVADNYRNELAARARFMMGEIHFGERRLDQAITDFQRVMYGYGAEKAPDSIKNWQAKSGFEAGRCSEVLMQQAKSQSGRDKAKKFATDFFQYVINKHPTHELAAKSKKILQDLQKP